MLPVVVRPVESRADYRTFFEFPWTLYREDRNWTPPLLSMRRDTLDQKKHPAWRYLEGDYFVAYRGDKPVGTIAPYINHRHNEHNREHIGWFGAFEVYDDEEAAHALLAAAGNWVKAKGYETMRGPQTFTTHDECGVLVNNFTPPVILMPYNPPYYAGLVERAGFAKAMDLYSYQMNHAIVKEFRIHERLEKMTKRLTRNLHADLFPITRRTLNESFHIFHKLYNEAWGKNWGFSPIDDAEIQLLIDNLSIFLDISMMYIARVGDEPVGIILPIPDMNEVLRKVQPRPGMPELLTMLGVFRYWKVQPTISTVRAALMGVKEEYRQKGVPALLLKAALEAWLKSNYKYVDAGWVLETNHDVIGLLETFGLQRYKTHRLYQKSLA